jgi:putative nucleotidyltransferase with HDIG domain
MSFRKATIEDVWKHYRETTDHAHDEKHIKEVVRIIKGLAAKHGVDKKKAELAATLHDVGREVEQSIPGLDHAVVGADIAANFTKDKEVLDAIRRHRKGSGEAPKTMLDKILWDADLVAGVLHAKERAYQWNRDAGLAPNAARKAADKHLKSIEMKGYEPANAFTPEAKEILKVELPKLREKVAALVEAGEELKKGMSAS